MIFSGPSIAKTHSKKRDATICCDLIRVLSLSQSPVRIGGGIVSAFASALHPRHDIPENIFYQLISIKNWLKEMKRNEMQTEKVFTTDTHKPVATDCVLRIVACGRCFGQWKAKKESHTEYFEAEIEWIRARSVSPACHRPACNRSASNASQITTKK